MEQTVYERNAELLERASSGDAEAEEQLMVANMGLVRSVAGHFLDRGTEYVLYCYSFVTFDSSFFPGARSLASRLAFKTEKTLFSLICLVYSNMSKGSLCFSHRADSEESLLYYPI